MTDAEELLTAIESFIDELLEKNPVNTDDCELIQYERYLYQLFDIELTKRSDEIGKRIIRKIGEKRSEDPRSWHDSFSFLTYTYFRLRMHKDK